MTALRKIEPRADNRAVTPFFRVFGGEFVPPRGDAVRLADMPGGHRGEWRLLAVLAPLMTGAAIFDALLRLGGPWLAWIATLPLLFVAINGLSFAIGGSTPRQHAIRWSILFTAWSGAQGLWLHGMGWAVTLWFGWMLLQGLGVCGLLWKRAMEMGGRGGMRLRGVIAVGLHLAMVVLWWFYGWHYGVLCGCLIGAIWCWGTLNPSSQLYGPVARRVEGDGPLLTIDDGPDPKDTPAILDALDAAGIKAVFFVIGSKVERYPDLACEILRRGHELGNHTLTHPQESFWCAGPWRTRREIEGCSKAIEAATGERPRWFRAPVGHRNYFTHPIATAAGMEVVAWTRRGYDAVRRDVPSIIREITADIVDGDILLMHEATPVAEEVARGVLSAFGANSAARKI